MNAERTMKPLVMPAGHNYIGVFLTFACNYRCAYCINRFEEKLISRKTMPGRDWIAALNRIESTPDLPVTLQGGEPSLHPDFLEIVGGIDPRLRVDILTNIQFDVDRFMARVGPERVKRDAPYASIRVSYHPAVMDLEETAGKVRKMMDKGYSVGLWGVMHPAQVDAVEAARRRCRELGIDFRTKEYLGEHGGEMHGEYKYAGACDRKSARKVRCRTTELLVDSAGSVYRCHHDLYQGVNVVGHILDPGFQIEDVFRDCGVFGHCNPCDVKVKTNRFQVHGHTSVEIEGA